MKKITLAAILGVVALLVVGIPLVTSFSSFASRATPPAPHGPHPPQTFVAHLSAAPGVSTQATGQATFQLSPNGQSLSYKLIVSNINNVFMAHIHLSPSMDILVWLYPNPNTVASGGEAACVAVLSGGPISSCPGFISGMFSGVLAQGTIAAADLSGSTTCYGCSGLSSPTMSGLIADMKSGQTYVNVHTKQNPAGEIQGTIVAHPSPPSPPPHIQFQSSVVGSTPNTPIDGIPSGGAPWVVTSAHAGISSSGMTHVSVNGLVISLPGSPLDGTTGPVTQVLASLVCQSSSGQTITSTNAVPLNSDGDAQINQMVTLPGTCFAPTILIRIAATTSGPVSNGPWIAATGFLTG